jgi:hypothetical protein
MQLAGEVCAEEAVEVGTSQAHLDARYRIVSFADFARTMRARGIDQAYLVKRFRDRFGDGIADVREFFDRVFQPRWGKVVIPHRSVVEFYRREIGCTPEAAGSERRCGCACGQRVFGKKKWASGACKQRGYRRRIAEHSKRPEKAA